MKISELPYYVKFVFMCDDGPCHSTADISMLDHILDPSTNRRIASIDVGDRIIFAPDTDAIFRVTKIGIRHLFEDTDDMRIGFDSEDCTEMQGTSKEWLLKILINTERDTTPT